MKFRNILITIAGVSALACSFLPDGDPNTSVNAHENFSPTPVRFQEITFTRLTIKEAERQKTGSLGFKGAIPKQDVVFTDAKTWEDFWHKYSVDEVVRVDFKKYSVAAVFSGEKESSGYSVEIIKILNDPASKVMRVKVEETKPSGPTGHLDVITYPSDVVMFPAQPSTVEFIHSGPE